ncbi:MAG: tRNA uridine-5-carboxymethylaminomethyl(34) synthesis GTPase MnmE [Opitutales bacterium]
MDFEDTIVAVATPYGESALAVIRLSGPLVSELAESAFCKTLQARKATYTSYRDLGGEAVDDVVATYFKGPASYTGQDLLEISCHGSPFVTRRIIDDCLARGCRSAEPGEFTQRSFRNGKMDLSQAEAVIELIHAQSESARKIALSQVGGLVSRTVSELTDSLLLALAQLEAYIDFPEEDLPDEDSSGPLQMLGRLSDKLEALADTSKYRALFTEGIKTVFVGAPNAGKSSLLNAFIGENRALVSEVAGTTRDYIREQFNLGPFGIQILDTAGLRDGAQDKIEQMGIERTIEQVERADCILWVVDGESPSLQIPDEVKRKMGDAFTYVLVNKGDSEYLKPVESDELPYPSFIVSAKSGDGISEFQSKWLADLEARLPDYGSESVIVSARHEAALRESIHCLDAAKQKLLDDAPVELAVSDIREAMEALGKIVGKIDNERMLDQLFNHFCIGK